MKKKIGITDTGNINNYITWFTTNDLLDDVDVVVLKNLNDLKSCSGLVLSGGVDINPEEYDGETDYPGKPEQGFDTQRDEFERNAYNYVKLNHIPVLGICRGMQLINVAEGGLLIQDLGPGNDIHKKNVEDKVHAIVVSQGTLLAEIVGQTKGNVNSAHHQAVPPDGIARALVHNAVSEAGGMGVIEGLEFKDKSTKGFMLAVQWHPERMTDKDESPFSKNIKSAFVRAVRNYENR